MPLILLCGFPSSGKTKTTTALVDYFTNACGKVVTVVGDGSFPASKNVVFSDSNSEKVYHDALRAQVQRLLEPGKVVICDAPNYVKAFRYELFCIAKQHSHRHAVVLCDLDAQNCRKLNESRPENERYTEDVFQALINRFERPSCTNRWDSPLFAIQSGDEIPLEVLREALFEGTQKVKPNQSTKPQRIAKAAGSDGTQQTRDFSFEIDSATQHVVSECLEQLRSASQLGDRYVAVNIADVDRPLKVPVTLTVFDIQKYRRQFIAYIRAHPDDASQANASRFKSMFVNYLNNLLGSN